MFVRLDALYLFVAHVFTTWGCYVLHVVKNKAILDAKDKQLKVNISHLLPLKNCGN